MHPLVARIHPSFRTAFFAWLIARVAVWMGSNLRLGRVFPEVGVATGTPLYRALTDLPPTWGPMALAGLTEVLLFVAVVATYRFARRDGMPQTADRATWLWIACPAMMFATPGSDWSIAYGLTALAFGAVGHLASPLLLAAAILFRPEAIVVYPGLCALSWSLRGKDADPAAALLACAVPAITFGITVLGGLLVADPGAMRAPELRWREGISWMGLENHLADLLVLLLLSGALAVTLQTAKGSPKSWLLVTLPALVFAAITLPPLAGVALIPLAIPLFVQLGRLAQDPAFERTLLAASVLALVLGSPACL